MIQVLPDKNNRPVDGDLFGHTLIADSTVSQELPPALMTRSRHESYWIGWPGGCEICIAIDVRFQAGASPDDIRRVGRFDFSCLTRWLKPCREKGDIMPGAWAQVVKEGAT